MTISIVMATYNGEKYLKEQLTSLYKQTRCADEVLIFDDGSTDSTCKLIVDFIKQHNLETSWHFSVNKHNKGCIINFLDGAEQASGDIVFYSDQDDIWDERKLELMEKGFIEHSDMVACYCLRHFIDVEGNEIPMHFDFMTNVKVKNDLFQKISIDEAVKYNKSPGLCLAIKRNLILETKEMIIRHGLTHDLPIGTVAAIHNGYYVLNEKLVYYRQHGNNVSAARITIKERLSKMDKQIAGRVDRYSQMEAIYQQYYDFIPSDERKYMLDAIDTTKRSVDYLKTNNVWKLFLMIFHSNPMMNRWIAVNNFLICLRGNA